MPAHPPFVGVPPRMLTDTLTHAGAMRLAAVIRQAWREAGHDIETEVVQVSSEPAIWTVRMPGLVNGLPTKRVPL